MNKKIKTWVLIEKNIMFQFAVLFVLSDLFSSISAATVAGCEIDPFSVNAPLLIENGKSSIIYPQYGERTVTIQAGNIVEFACPQKNVLTNGQQRGAIVAATCVSNQRFRINNEVITWNRVTCSADPISTSRATNEKCGNSGKSAEIGFILDNRRFLQTMQICFDPTKQITLYSHFEMTSTIAIRSVTTQRPPFYEDTEFYNLNGSTVNSLYVRNVQRRTINRLLGLALASTKYIQTGDLFFLARGHLTANSDFVYTAQRNSTFKYINAAPHWQTFNAFNWAQVEEDTRNYATSHKVGLQVWTGTYGVASLPHETSGKDTELYLYTNANTRAIPVPAIFWKIVYNPLNRRGIVLIGVNNPFLNQTDLERYKICNDISNSVNWLKWDKTNILRGYSYACTVPAFRRVVTYAPSLKISGLLV